MHDILDSVLNGVLGAAGLVVVAIALIGNITNWIQARRRWTEQD